MYLVKTYKGLHSQWNNEPEALEQAEVLREHGYDRVTVEYINAECNVNGYYYV